MAPDRGGARGLLVDYGGVLTTPVTRSFRLFCRDLGMPSEAVKETFLEAYGGEAGGGPVHQLETGQITVEVFAQQLAGLLAQRTGIDVAPDNLVERLFAHVELDETMLGAVLAARGAGVRTGLLSNSWGEDGYPRDRFGALFDAVVISGEVGLRKPDPAIFALAAQRLGLAPEECVFVDDLDVNVFAAEAAGMTGVVHRSATETLPQLVQLLGLAEGQLGGGPAEGGG